MNHNTTPDKKKPALASVPLGRGVAPPADESALDKANRLYRIGWQTLSEIGTKFVTYDGQASDRATRRIPLAELAKALRLDGCQIKGVTMSASNAHTPGAALVQFLEVDVRAPEGACLFLIKEVGTQRCNSPQEAIDSLGLPPHVVQSVTAPDSNGTAMVRLHEPMLVLVPCPAGVLNDVLSIARDGDSEMDEKVAASERMAALRRLLGAERAMGDKASAALCASLEAEIEQAALICQDTDQGVDPTAPLANAPMQAWDPAVMATAKYLTEAARAGTQRTVLSALLGVIPEQVGLRMRRRFLDGSNQRLVDAVAAGAASAGWSLGGFTPDGDVALMGPPQRRAPGEDKALAWEDEEQVGGQLARRVYLRHAQIKGIGQEDAERMYATEAAAMPSMRKHLAYAAREALRQANPADPRGAAGAAAMSYLATQNASPSAGFDELMQAYEEMAVDVAEAWALHRLAGERMRSALLEAPPDGATLQMAKAASNVAFAYAVAAEQQAQAAAKEQGTEYTPGRAAWLLLLPEQPWGVQATEQETWAKAVGLALARIQ